MEDAFDSLSRSETFWLNVVSPRKEEITRSRPVAQNVTLSFDGHYELAKLFSRIIDFCSPFTALYSSMMVATAERLSRTPVQRR